MTDRSYREGATIARLSVLSCFVLGGALVAPSSKFSFIYRESMTIRSPVARDIRSSGSKTHFTVCYELYISGGLASPSLVPGIRYLVIAIALRES
ncbi:hypothetical protein BJX68DRAFT_234559 [Aspergillus pseudodeflectus]|uniref:Secreted protein n=1 Tax=Aspergillus pseudodeflectus TaxID=176178 RepID=A0ABR4KK81_9EURO